MGLVADKVVLVTGAGSGIGRAAAELFAAEGARGVVVADIDAAAGEQTVACLRGRGADAVFCKADVTGEEQVAAMVGLAMERYGRLDCAFNNAGVPGAVSGVADLDLHEWNRVLACDLTGVFLCMKHELRVMVPAGRGVVVNTSSGAGVVASPGLAHYAAAKHGVLGLTKTAAQELLGTGIRVNAVCPGVIDTPMLRAATGGSEELEKMVRRSAPGGVPGRPEQVAEAAVWLCSDRSEYVTGETLIVDGGAISR